MNILQMKLQNYTGNLRHPLDQIIFWLPYAHNLYIWLLKKQLPVEAQAPYHSFVVAQPFEWYTRILEYDVFSVNIICI